MIMTNFVSGKVNLIAVILMLLVITIGCKNEGKRTSGSGKSQTVDASDVTGTLNIEGDDVFVNVMNELGSEFKRKYPGVKINVSISPSYTAIESLDSGEADIAFVSIPSSQLNLVKYNFVSVGRDFLVLIVNFNNNYLQTLVMYGISQKILADILTLKIDNWKKVHTMITGDEPLKMYIPSKQSASLDYLAAFAGLKKEQIKADDVIAEKDVPINVGNMPVSIGFCSHTLAYDHASGLRRQGIYILGIDANNSGFLENEELIYDDMKELEVAVKNNLAPEKLVRTFKAVTRNDSENNELIVLFIDFLKENVYSIVEKHKFYGFKTNPNN